MNRDLELRKLAADLQRPENLWTEEDRVACNVAFTAVMAYVPDGHDRDYSAVPTDVLREFLRVCAAINATHGVVCGR